MNRSGFAHVLVYGPSGVGKTTMIRQIAKRLNENLPEHLPNVSNSLSYRNGSQAPMPLLLLETRPPLRVEYLIELTTIGLR